MTRVVQDEAYAAFRRAEGVELGTRIKDVRDEPLEPGGRVRMTLFERVDGGRPHPRLRFEPLTAEDPAPGRTVFAPAEIPSHAEGWARAIDEAFAKHAAYLDAADLEPSQLPELSPRWFRARIRVQRIAAAHATIRAAFETALEEGAIADGQQRACRYVIAQREDEHYATDLRFDDADTGTYHSYGHDAPFVHYLEQILETLPTEGSEAMELLMPGTREAVRRQRDHAQAHLDHLMRHKYSYELTDETDIERTIGGFLVDRTTRHIASVVPDSDPIVPRYELLRIDPTADHPAAGAWVYRDADGRIRDESHAIVEVADDLVRSAPKAAGELTFRRAPKDRHLRPGIAFDWDDSGWIDPDPIDWVSWAGHCDVKAVLEQLGVTLTDHRPSVTEWRSDTGEARTYDRDLLLEMLASILELGSVYAKLDGTGYYQRGSHHFGGSRNDARPDRLQFTGPGEGRSFRWPLGGRQGSFVVTKLQWPDAPNVDMGTVFYRYLPDRDAVTFDANPRFLKTVEGDYNLIDVSGARIEADAQIDGYDPETGYPTKRRETIVIDLRPEAGDARCFLGTHIDDAARRRLYRAYYEPAHNRIVAELEVWRRGAHAFEPEAVESERIVMPMVSPLRVTLSREMKRDDPSQFSEMLTLALREAANICADTDKAAEVWNGVVTRLTARRVADNRDARTEHWRVDLAARFGDARLEYLVQRQVDGRPKTFVPAVGEDDAANWPDFLWREEPDIGSKGVEEGDWVINDTMAERGLVTVRPDASVPSGFYVYDDHIKNVFELLYAGLAGYSHTIVHDNKRHGFANEVDWKAARRQLEDLRAQLTFED